MALGPIGIWRPRHVGLGAVGEIEALGYAALWLGGSSVDQARPCLDATSTLIVATGILNIWQYEAAAVAREHAVLTREFPGRFLLGLGIGHPEHTGMYARPLAMMQRFLDGLDAADSPVPRKQRVVAALGPRMLDLAAERSLGAHPYFTPPEHTRLARERCGEGALIAPEVTVVVEPDPDRGRRLAREFAALYLGLDNYRRHLLRLGFGEDDLAGGGSDRLIDAIVPHGPAGAIADAVHAHLEAGADHVALQPVGHGSVPLDDYRALAAVLLP